MGQQQTTPTEPIYIYDHVPADCEDYEIFKLTGQCEVGVVDFRALTPHDNIPIINVNLPKEIIGLMVGYCPSRWYPVSKYYKELAKKEIASSQFIRYQWCSGSMIRKALAKRAYDQLNVFLELGFPDTILYKYDMTVGVLQRLVKYGYKVPNHMLISGIKSIKYEYYKDINLLEGIYSDEQPSLNEITERILQRLINDCDIRYGRNLPDAKYTEALKLMSWLYDHVINNESMPDISNRDGFACGHFAVIRVIKFITNLKEISDFTRTEYRKRLINVIKTKSLHFWSMLEDSYYSSIVEALITVDDINSVVELAANKHNHFQIMLSMFYVTSRTCLHRATIESCLKSIKYWNVSKTDMGRCLRDNNLWIYDYCGRN